VDEHPERLLSTSDHEQRTRQAVRGIKEMFRKDGLMPRVAA
jgi:hypothetical protein